MPRECTGNSYLEDFKIWPSHLERLSMLCWKRQCLGLLVRSWIYCCLSEVLSASWSCGVGLPLLSHNYLKSEPRQWGFGELAQDLEQNKPTILQSSKFRIYVNQNDMHFYPPYLACNLLLTEWWPAFLKPWLLTGSPSKAGERIDSITLNRQKKPNALDKNLYFRLATLMHEVAAMLEIYITILTGSGRYFSAYGRAYHSIKA